MTTLAAVPMSAESVADSTLLRFPRMSRQRGLVHAVTVKPWNLAPHRGPGRERAVERRGQLCAALGLDFERLTAAEQIHSHHVVRVRARDVGAGRMGRETAIRFVDGLVCDLPGTALLQLSADCPLLLVFDPRRGVLGTAHASWRGTVARMAEQLVQSMRREFGSQPGDLLAGICPCAGPTRYEVGEEVRRVAAGLLADADRYFPTVNERRCFDLRGANADQLVRAGVDASNIEIAAECTIGDERFYSHRREGEATGRFGLIAAIAP